MCVKPIYNGETLNKLFSKDLDFWMFTKSLAIKYLLLQFNRCTLNILYLLSQRVYTGLSGFPTSPVTLFIALIKHITSLYGLYVHIEWESVVSPVLVHPLLLQLYYKKMTERYYWFKTIRACCLDACLISRQKKLIS